MKGTLGFLAATRKFHERLNQLRAEMEARDIRFVLTTDPLVIVDNEQTPKVIADSRTDDPPPTVAKS